MIYFELADEENVCVVNEKTLWHCKHGGVYNCLHVTAEHVADRKLGVFYVTMLPGIGGIVHVETCCGAVITPADILGAWKKLLKMLSATFPVILANVSAGNKKLLNILLRSKFTVVDRELFATEEEGGFILLKYLPESKCYVKNTALEEESGE